VERSQLLSNQHIGKGNFSGAQTISPECEAISHEMQPILPENRTESTFLNECAVMKS
jgi:hypothetical protein